ncbi:hypothetical protein OKW42_003471 [Paraburkholderia sp. WC7.3d]|nr:hypothetical protein [Paraburkholderia podalyriae]
MKITTVGIDLAKNIFGFHGVNEHGTNRAEKGAQAKSSLKAILSSNSLICSGP